MASVNNLFITNTGLSKVACELINKRSYNSELIERIGNPLVTAEGIASAFNEESYLAYSPLSFSQGSSSVTIKTSCIYEDESSTYQPLISLSGNEYSLFFLINNSSILIKKNNTELLSVSDLSFKNDDNLSVTLEINSLSYKLILIHNKERKVYSGNLTESINFSEFSTIYVGKDTPNSSNFWKGFIDLTNLQIFEGTQLIYSPSYDTSFRFSHILISDGTIDLTDDSIETYKHVYKFDVVEVNRTSNNILLTARIGENVYLNINQIGLYIAGQGKTFLFGLASGLALQKEKNLGYNLVFNVNLNLGVANTSSFPDIVVKKETYPVYSDFHVLETVHTNTVIDLERIISMNALLLGYEPDEVFYQLFNDTKLINENYIGAHTYARISQNVHSHYTREYTGENINITGKLPVSSSIIKGFTTKKYASLDTSFALENNWEFVISFTNMSRSKEETICCFCDSSNNPFLKVSINEANYLCINMSSNGVLINKELFKVSYLKETFFKITFDGFNYNFYKKENGDSSFIKVASVSSNLELGLLSHIYFGVLNDNGIISSPFYGSINLANLILISNGTDFSPSITTYHELELKDFYYLMNYPSSFYKIKNLSNLPNSDISYLEGSITGKHDSIDFSNPIGFSILAKVNLNREHNQSILYKLNPVSGATYFSLEVEDDEVIFKLYLSSSVVTLKKGLINTESEESIGNIRVITVTCDNQSGNPVFSMYFNNVKVSEMIGTNKEYLIADAYKITNYTSITEATENKVDVVLSFSGVLNKDEIHEISTLLGANF